MSWKRIATYALGGGLVALGAFVPAAGAVTITAGVGLLGLATRWPEDSKKIKALEGAVGRLEGEQATLRERRPTPRG